MKSDAFDKENMEAMAEKAAAAIAARNRVNEIKDARLRLTCAALTGILAGDVSVPGGAVPHDKVALWSVGLADEVLALLYPSPAPNGGNDGRS